MGSRAHGRRKMKSDLDAYLGVGKGVARHVRVIEGHNRDFVNYWHWTPMIVGTPGLTRRQRRVTRRLKRRK